MLTVEGVVPPPAEIDLVRFFYVPLDMHQIRRRGTLMGVRRCRQRCIDLLQERARTECASPSPKIQCLKQCLARCFVVNVGDKIVMMVNIEQKRKIVRQARKSQLVLWLCVGQENSHERKVCMLQRKPHPRELHSLHRLV